MEEAILFDNDTPNIRDGDYMKKVFTNDILFIPDYIYKAINSSGVTIEQYLDTIKAAKTSPNFKEMYDLFYNESEDLKTYARTLDEYNQKIVNTIGSEIKNLIQIQKYILSLLKINYRDNNDVEYTFIRGLSSFNKNYRYSSDMSSINLLKTNKDVKFEETYVIVNSDICLVILKDGFGNHIDDNGCKKKLLDDIVDSRQLFMSNAVFGSYFMKSSIELNLSNFK